ncbi:AT-hook motif nuclear-localized protein 1 [Neltuma alba]|uniref:AT-hook motif nuclear-localized protein 1 n=1 Tax=Neltuma alba TaxID=207710 RepID=UPI0010A45BF1|nr:AT-hook motif nuclear-localized protein 1-like [Prosopis alba]
MEVRDVVNNGVTVVRSDAPSNYHVAPRTEVPSSLGGSTAPAPQGSVAPPQPVVAGVATAATTMPVKKKRGRPRKYGPDGSVAMALSPSPLSSSAPPAVIDFSAGKRGKVRPANSVRKAKFEVEDSGEWVAGSVGTNFTPHIIAINSGEDITMKIISFSQQGPRAICILSASGVISSVMLRQADSSGGTLTHEGRFEILSLSGSFMPNESAGTRSRSGGMSVSLASPDGRVIGGSVAGLLLSLSIIQVVVGSFLAGNQHDLKTKKQKHEIVSTAIVPLSTADPIPILSSPPSFPAHNWSALPSDTRNNMTTDINVPLSAG